MRAIPFHSIYVRIAAVLIAAGLFVFSLQILVWAVAGSAAGGVKEKEAGEVLTMLSPSDPQTHLSSAVLYEKAYEPGDLERSLAEYELAAALAPNDYLVWVRLGSARGRSGDAAGAESALRRAIELAPHYSRVHWALGNLLLREGREDEAYQHIRKAVESDPSLAGAAVTTAYQLSEGTLAAIRERFSGLPDVNLRLALLLLEHKKYTEAMDVWRSIERRPDTASFADAAKQFAQKLVEAKQFRAAAQVGSALDPGAESSATGKFTNPGFESPVRSQNAGAFEWKVPQSNSPQFAVTDAVKRSGRYSLLTLMNSSDGKDFQGISQTVAVEPGGRYRLSANYRSDVRSKAEYFIEVVSAIDSKRLAISEPLTPTSDWRTVNIDLDIPGDADGIHVRLVRGPCIGSACAATGSMWLDDFDLTAR